MSSMKISSRLSAMPPPPPTALPLWLRLFTTSLASWRELITTVHAIMATQKTIVVLLGSCGMVAMLIPRTSSLLLLGTAKTMSKVTPELNGELTGIASWVPAPMCQSWPPGSQL